MALLGLDGVLYFGTTYDEATVPLAWDEITNVRDLSLNLEKSDADVTTRGANGWKQIITALKDGTVEFEMIYDKTDTVGFAVLQAAFFAGTQVWCQVMDSVKGATVPDADGLQALMEVASIGQTQNLEDAQKVSISLKPAHAPNNPPEWITAQ